MLSAIAIIFYGLSVLINLIGIVCNLLQIVLGIFRSPASFKVYVLLLVNSGFCDLISCLTALFVQARIFANGKSLFFVSNGLCQYFGGDLCRVSYSVTLHCYTHNMWSLMICFVFRYMAIRSVNVNRLQIGFFLLCVYLMSLTQLVTGLELTIKKYNFQSNTVFGVPNILDPRVLYFTLHMSLPIFPIYGVIFWCRNMSLRTLERMESMSQKTRQLHAQLLHALTCQAVLPAVYIFSLFLYIMAALDLVYHSAIESTTTLLVSLIPALSPLVRLYYLRPYREWISTNLFRKKPNNKVQAFYSSIS